MILNLVAISQPLTDKMPSPGFKITASKITVIQI